MSFIESVIDDCLFLRATDKGVVYLLVYVDDIVIIGIDATEIENDITRVNVEFELKDLGTLNYLPAPMSGNFLCKSYPFIDYSLVTDTLLYRSTIGAFQHVCITKPNIKFVVNKLGQYMQFISMCHWKAVTRVLRYLNGIVHQGLLFKSNPTFSNEVSITYYVDVD